mmetsp:Transcript_26236/g.59346  ORF Transcript_26236/g.59346 Transcript_26236/m.59346 type:complete len:769 (+) Transcript_26236:763-3069(+)
MAFDDDLDEDDLREEMEKQRQGMQVEAESRVGKKLSDMTTRRVIVLVLLLLFSIPNFQAENWYSKSVSSQEMGADAVVHAWYRYNFLCKPKRFYENELLTYIYYHNPHSTECTTPDPEDASSILPCPADQKASLFWVGLVFPATDEPVTKNSTCTLCNEERGCPHITEMTADKVGYNTSGKSEVDYWNDQYKRNGNEGFLYDTGELPQRVYDALTKKWTASCFGDRDVSYIGVSLVDDVSCPEELRWNEYESLFGLFRPSDANAQGLGALRFYFDKRKWKRIEAVFGIITTIFVCVLLAVASMSFSKDANELVLNPIERISAKLLVIRDSPMAAIKLGDVAYREEQAALRLEKEREEKASWFSKASRLFGRKKKKKSEPMETAILEKTIIKIGGLLALGFGEAGARIIGQNMKGSDTAGVNAMIPGTKIDCIFGYSEIHHFAETMQVLQDKVMLFVNQIAEIVHGIVDEYLGAPNKNVGDAFLLVWRLVDVEPQMVMKYADFAVLAFVKIIAAVNKSATFADYRDHPGLLLRIPNFRVTLHFGLHYGWAIEGAIGSEFKIDASYLSPNVNTCWRLASEAKQYELLMLVSHVAAALCSSRMQKNFRLLDRVELKGSKQPIGLHTVDLDWRRLDVAESVGSKVVFKKYKMRQQRERVKEMKQTPAFDPAELFMVDRDIKLMRELYTSDFFDAFDMAYRNYEAGEWEVARVMLEETLLMLGHEDGPSRSLLNFMQSEQHTPHRRGSSAGPVPVYTGRWVAPKSWQGYRSFK